MILDRIGTALAFLGNTIAGRLAAADLAQRWAAAFTRDPRLAGDLMRLGGVLRPELRNMTEGEATLAPLDPHRLAYEAGQRDLALQLLALGRMSFDDINQLALEDQDHE